MLYIVYRKVHIYYIYHKIEKMNKTVMDLLFFYEIDNQECWVSRSVRGLVVGKIHGISGIAGQSSRVSGVLSEKMSATYQGWRVPETMYLVHMNVVDYRLGCLNGTSRVTSISWYVQSGRSSGLSIRLGLVSESQIRKIRCSEWAVNYIEKWHEDEK